MEKFNLRYFLALFMASLFTFSPAQAQLLGATADIDVTPEIGVPMAGYAGVKRRSWPWQIFRRKKYSKYFKPSVGKRDPIRAKVMVLEKNQEKLLFISLDLIGSIDHFKTDLMRRIRFYGFEYKNVFITATHTHSGPGALTYNSVWAMLAMDKFKRSIYTKFMDGIVEAVETALNKMEPVELLSNKFEVSGVQRNRADRPGQFDNNARMVLLKSKADGAWLGGLMNLAIHPVALGQKNRHLSSDIPGAIERKLELELTNLNPAQREKPTILFTQGALGDVSPAEKGEHAIEWISDHVVERATQSLSSLKFQSEFWRSFETEVYLGKPGLSPYSCTKQGFFGRLFSWNRWLRGFRFSLRRWLPQIENLYALKIGDMLMVSWPGEPTAKLGEYLQEMGASKGASDTWVLATTNNHLAYFVTPEEERQGGGEVCSMLYDAKVSMKIIDKYDQLLQSIY